MNPEKTSPIDGDGEFLKDEWHGTSSNPSNFLRTQLFLRSWFERWGTGEALNNGTHELDVMRWGLGVDFPTRVTAAGGRYAFQDDWEFPDTMVLTLEVDKSGIVGYGFTPAWINHWIPEPAVGDLGRAIVDRMADYSRPMNALVVPDPEARSPSMRSRSAGKPSRSREGDSGSRSRILATIPSTRSRSPAASASRPAAIHAADSRLAQRMGLP